eukprot:4689825-Amphidinium_carterae.2
MTRRSIIQRSVATKNPSADSEDDETCSTGEVFDNFFLQRRVKMLQHDQQERFLVCQTSAGELPELFALSAQALILDDEAWLPDVCSEASTEGDTLGGTRVGTMCENDETLSLSAACLQEDLTSSNEEEGNNDDINLVGRVQASREA